jgi:competence protein ComEC
VTGLRPSACRAAIMGAIFFGGMLIGREPHVINSTAAAALVILLPDTNQLFRPGFQLSFLVLLSIAILANTVGKYLSRPFYPDPFLPISLVPRRRLNLFAGARKASGLTGVSTAAWAGSTPLTWIYFGLLTPISIVANLILIPLAFLVLGTSAFSVALAIVPHPLPAELANEATALWAKSAATSAGAFSEIPGGHWNVPSPQHLFRKECEITILDLPYGGAATHIALRGGGDWLIDSGSEHAFRRSTHPLLRAYGVGRLDGLLLTAADVEHVGGGAATISEYTPHRVLTTPANSTSPGWRRALATADAEGIEIERPVSGDVIELGRGNSLHILYPPDGLPTGFVADDRALVIQLRLANGCRLLFLGDSGFYTERWLLEHTPPETLRSDILIKGQHGSDLAELPGMIDSVSPRAVVINGLSKAAASWAGDLRERGIAIFNQRETGAVQIRIEGSNTVLDAFLGDRSLILETAN